MDNCARYGVMPVDRAKGRLYNIRARLDAVSREVTDALLRRRTLGTGSTQLATTFGARSENELRLVVAPRTKSREHRRRHCRSVAARRGVN